MLIPRKIKLSIRLTGTTPDNTRGLHETLGSGVETFTLLASWEVLVIKNVSSSVDEGGFGFDEFDDSGGGFDKVNLC